MPYYDNNYNSDFGTDRGGMAYYDYFAQLAEAQKREKRGLFVNCSKLGGLLLIYNFLMKVMVYVYYLVVYAVKGGRLTLSVAEAARFLSDHEEIVSSSLFSMSGNLFIVVMSMIPVMLIAKFAMKIDFSEMLKPRRGQALQAVKWFPLCMTLNTAASIVIAFFTLYMSGFGITVPESDFTITPSTAAVVVQFVYVVVIGPVAEELLYRGVVLTLLKPYGKFMAVFFSALIFGIMHGNIPQAASAFTGALVFGIIAVQCNSIIPTILIHIANNMVASYSDFAAVYGWKYADEILMALEIAIILAGVYVLFVSGWKLRLKNDNRYALPSSQRYAAVFTNVFMIVYFLYALYEIAKEFIMANT